MLSAEAKFGNRTGAAGFSPSFAASAHCKPPSHATTEATGRTMEAAEAANAAIQQRYTKDKKVGEGTYAVVYLGRQVDTQRKIAIKKVSEQSARLDELAGS